MTLELQNLRCEMSERAFVGCVIASQATALDGCPATEEHFFDPVARMAFTAAIDLYRAGAPVNKRTVLQKVGSERIEILGGAHIISDVCSYPSPGQAAYFFGILEGKLALRRAYDVARWAESEVKTTDDPQSFVNGFRSRIETLEAASEGENCLPLVLDEIEKKIARMEAGEVSTGFMSPIPAWNKAFGGIMDGQLYGLAGRPGTGKTAMMEMMIQEYLKKEIPVCVFEKDMSPQKLIERCVCRATQVPFWRFARGFLPDVQLRNLRLGVEYFRGAPLYLYNPRGLTAEKFCAISRRDIRTRGVKAVFLDHVQALRVGKDLREGLTQASLAIRANVTETNIPHIILAHINRNGAKGRPAPEDIKEFDQLYGDADGMVLLWSEQSRADVEPGKGIPVTFYAAKNRDGAVMEEEMNFNGEMLTFEAKPPK